MRGRWRPPRPSYAGNQITAVQQRLIEHVVTIAGATTRAVMILLSVSGMPASEIAVLLHYDPATVRRWIARHDLEGLAGAPGPARAGRSGRSKSVRSSASRTAGTSPPGTAPHPSTHPPATRSATGSPGPGTGRSTGSCTSWPPSSCAIPPKAAPTSTARRQPGRRRWKRCEH